MIAYFLARGCAAAFLGLPSYIQRNLIRAYVQAVYPLPDNGLDVALIMSKKVQVK